MGQATPVKRPPGSRRQKGAHSITRELLSKLRITPRRDGQTLQWSMAVGDLSDHELDAVLERLRSRGVQAKYQRDLQFLAHFELTW